MENFSLYINGVLRTVCVPPQWTLLRVLRETLGLTGAKNGCSSGDCGACRVILDGTAVNACKVPIKDAAGHRVETIEGLSRNGQLHPIQQAFIDCGAVPFSSISFVMAPLVFCTLRASRNLPSMMRVSTTAADS